MRKYLDLKNGRPTCHWATNTIPIDLTRSISPVHVSVQDLQWQVRVLQPQPPYKRAFHFLQVQMTWRQCHQKNMTNIPGTIIPCTSQEFKKRTATNESGTCRGCRSPLPKLALLNKRSQRRNAWHELFKIMSP